MASKARIERNNKVKRLVLKYASRRAELKKIVCNRELSLAERFAAQLKLDALPKNSSRVRIRQRCRITGRSRGVEGYFQLSRNCLREMASDGKLPGVIKASW